MRRLFSWITTHKVAVLLMLVIVWMWAQNNPRLFDSITSGSSLRTYESDNNIMGVPSSARVGSKQLSYPLPYNEAAPAPDVADRMVVQNSHISLLVKNVADSIRQIKQHAASVGGYMIDASLSNPQEAASGTITVRVPQRTLDSTLDFIRSLGVKVVSENLQGTDVTDQFVDNTERLRILEGNKARMESIMDRAVEVSDITSIQQQIFSIQNQIDSIKGQQNYLEKTSELAKVTVYLSTDELALPYAPGNEWRPALVFKQAIRSVLVSFQNVGSLLIWLGVYSLIIVPVVLLFVVIRRRFIRKKME